MVPYLFRYQPDEISLLKKDKKKKKRIGYAMTYPYPGKTYYKVFQTTFIEVWARKFKFLLPSFKNKYAYYVIDDILKINSTNKEDYQLLEFVRSSMLFLHNNLYINLFDIWIGDIYINEIENNNKLPILKHQNSKVYTELTLILFYKVRSPYKKRKSLW